MTERTWIEYGGVGVDLGHAHETSGRPMLLEAQRWIERGQRPPLLTVKVGGVGVSERPDLWPTRERAYRGLGRLEWVGLSHADEPVASRTTA